MKRIKYSSESGWPLDQYFEYVESIKHSIPSHVYDLASDKSNYDLSSHTSLHDAWLESICISEPASGDRSEVRGVFIKARYLGPFHDLHIELDYSNVIGYEIIKTGSDTSCGHGDLLMHEFYIDDRNYIFHEIIFSNNSQIKIKCENVNRKNIFIS